MQDFTITHVNGTLVNHPDSPYVLVLKRRETAQQIAVAATMRQRPGFYPIHDVTSHQAFQQGFSVRHKRTSGMDHQAYNRAAYGLFDPGQTVVTLTGVFASGDEPETYTSRAHITSFGQVDFAAWEGMFLWPEPVWIASVADSATTSPLAVGGNTTTRPVITITDGEPATRYRLTLRDMTGESIAGWSYGVDVSGEGLDEHHFEVWLNNAPQPFKLIDGTLWFQVAITAGQPTFVDILASSEINNTDSAGALLDAGVTLNTALLNGTATIDPANVTTNPRSVALAFQPGISGDHHESRRYTMGFAGDGRLTLMDTEGTGQQVILKNDADSYVISSPVEMHSISGLRISAFAGYRRGQQAERNGVRMLMVRISDALGSPFVAGPTVPEYYYAAGRHRTRPYYAQFNFGGLTFPRTFSRQFTEEPSGQGTFYTRPGFYHDYMPHEFGELAAKHIGCQVINGVSGIWYLRFGPNAYDGGQIPSLSMSILPKSGRFIAQTILGMPESIFSDQPLGDTALDNIVVLQSEPVDPVTRQPLGRQGDNTPVEDVYGSGRVMVWYWTREREEPIVAASWNLRGAASPGDVPVQPGVTVSQGEDGLEYTIQPGTINTPGAVKIAIGLAPATSGISQVDWAAMTVDEPVTVSLDTDQYPAATQVTVPGQMLTGILRNLTTGARIRFPGTYSDANGIEIDCTVPAIQGAGGVGMIVNPPLPSEGVRFFDLPPGDEIEWDATGPLDDATISLSWQQRLLGEL